LIDLNAVIGQAARQAQRIHLFTNSQNSFLTDSRMAVKPLGELVRELESYTLFLIAA
jgi:hypothetical protein